MTWDYSAGDVITVIIICITVYFHFTRVVLRMDKMEKKTEGELVEINSSLKTLETRMKSAEDYKVNLAERLARVEEWREEHDRMAMRREDLLVQHGQFIASTTDKLMMLDKRLSRWEEILMRREEERSKHA